MKKLATLIALALLAVLQAAVAWNAHLLAVAQEGRRGPGEAVRTLKLANRVYPWNDLVHLELGRALFEQAAETLGDPGARDEALLRSSKAFMTALRLNPGSAAGHFHFAQTLLYMNYLSLPVPMPPFEGYKRAAALTGHNTQIFFEVGRVLLARWEELSAEEKDFTLGILEKAMSGRSEDRLSVLLEAWGLGAERDPAVIERILPEDPSLFRSYARFLGERSTRLAARHGALAKAEHLEFLKAKDDLARAERAIDYFQGEEAETRLRSGLRALDSVLFYQSLAGIELIDQGEFETVRKTVLRLLVQDRIDRTRSLDDPDGMLDRYLDLEDRIPVLGEFEAFLRERGLPGEGGLAAGGIGDLRVLAFRTALDFKQNRYRDIVRAGDALASSYLVVPDSGRPDYVRVLVLIGESCLKLDFVYEAENHFRKALEIAPGDLGALLGIERCYERLNDGPKAAAVRRTIEGLLAPRRLDLDLPPVGKGRAFSVDLVLDGRPQLIRIEFEGPRPEAVPLITAVFNGRVAWEGRLEEGAVTFRTAARTGSNALRVEVLGGPVRPVRITRETNER